MEKAAARESTFRKISPGGQFFQNVALLNVVVNDW
jgi:hypothetical protein